MVDIIARLQVREKTKGPAPDRREALVVWGDN
jgi:hypothetical protein